MHKLTPKQEKFALLISEGLSQRKAYREAYPKSQKWENSTVDVTASKLQSNTKVLLRLKELREEAEVRSAVKADHLIKELSHIALVNVADCFDNKGYPIPFDKLPEYLQKAVVGVEYKTFNIGQGMQKIIPVYKFAKEAALDKLMRHFGQYKDKLDVDGIDLKEIQVAVQLKVDNEK